MQADYLPNGQAKSFLADARLPDGRRPGRRRDDVAAVPAGGEQPAAPGRQPGLPARPGLRTALHRAGSPTGSSGPAEIQWKPVDPAHAALPGRHEVRPPRRHRRAAAAHHAARDHRPARAHQLRRQGRDLGVPRPARPGGRDRRAARRPRSRRRPRAVIFEVDQSKIDSGALARVARANLVPGPVDHARRRHRRARSTTCGAGSRCRSATTPASSPCSCSRSCCSAGSRSRYRASAPVLGPVHPRDRRRRCRTYRRGDRRARAHRSRGVRRGVRPDAQRAARRPGLTSKDG